MPSTSNLIASVDHTAIDLNSSPTEIVSPTSSKSSDVTSLVSEFVPHETVTSKSDEQAKRKGVGNHYKTLFKSEWIKKWPFIKKGSTDYHFYCNVCTSELSCANQGVTDVIRHVSCKSHTERVKKRGKQSIFVLLWI